MAHEYTYSTNGPVCPYCEFEHTPDESYYYNDGITIECGECDKPFYMGVEHTTSWTCEPKQ